MNLERQMLHAQKLESLGILAGGIAHDFNNILTAIIGNADLALMRINKESPAVDNLNRIEQSAARAADLAKQMLAYSGKGKFFVESIDLDRLLEEMLHMLEVSISKKVVLRLNLHHSLPSVEADATQMRQIVMNLVINASEAIGDKSGIIAITTGCMECERSYLKDVWLDENLVDDEETVRGIGAEMLKELGFTTITANDGREGLAAFKENKDIVFVLLDLTMPHMDGEQCFRELRQLKPDIKVIMSSGYNEQEVTQKFAGKGLAGFIQKPYRLSTLREVIQNITGKG